MSLPISLAVRLGNEHITRSVSDIAFRKEAVGGIRNITFKMTRGVSSIDVDLTPFTKVYLYDSRTAQTIAEGRLSDSGRTAEASGQSWDVVAFGPAQHASDVNSPLIYVDRSVSEGWSQVDVVARAEASIGSGTKPGDTASSTSQGILASFTEGSVLVTNHRVVTAYSRLAVSRQTLARVSYDFDAGVSDALWRIRSSTYTDGVFGETPTNDATTTGSGTTSASVTTNFPAGRNELRFWLLWNSSPSGTAAADVWAFWENVSIRAVTKTAAGADITTGYTANYALPHEVVNDLLGRMLPDFDGANATVATNTYHIDQMAYPEGVTAAQVLDDLMELEPGYRWYTTPDTTGNGYGFRWELWPTTVRYEITLDDGGSFPMSGQELFNAVNVRWRDAGGSERSTRRTLYTPVLDNNGLLRQTTIDLGSEVGTITQAEQAGDKFLIDHNVPRNVGTLKVARPIRDLITGRMVDPWEIEAGELARVVGVESYADSLNANNNDGETVFRIFAMDYTSSDNSANLTLDADPSDVASMLASLLVKRPRFNGSTRRKT